MKASLSTTPLSNAFVGPPFCHVQHACCLWKQIQCPANQYQRQMAAPHSSNLDQAETQLFSNLNPRTLKHEPGSVWGSALLVSGTTVGAGILALPSVTQEAGFVPAAATLTAVCAFSIATGLLVAEVSLRLMQQRGAGSVSMISMASSTLGSGAAAAASAAYIFLHYALLVAYISKAGEIVAGATDLPLVPSAAAFTLAFGLLCYLTSQQQLDRLNGALVGLVVACFLGLLVAASPGVDVVSLGERGNWSAVPATLPVVALAFVFHNVVPVVVQALEGDRRKVATAICAGVAIPWLMFVSWEAAILGSLGPLEAAPAAAVVSQAGGPAVAGSQLQVQTAPQTATMGSSVSQTPGTSSSSSSSAPAADPLAALASGNATVGPLIQGFSFLAIATSFIGFILGLTDFIVDGLKLPNRQAPVPYMLTLLPPFVVAVSNPNIFLQALDTAGTYGVLTLFGILPAAMAWQARYGATAQQQQSDTAAFSLPAPQPLLPGGAPVLIAVGGAAAAVVMSELLGLIIDR